MDNHSNQRIADAISSVNTMVVGNAPSIAAASQAVQLSFYQGLAAANGVFAQQQAWMQQQTATTVDVLQLLRR